MAYSYVQYPANGSLTDFSITFGYLSKSHIEVRVDGVLKTVDTDYTFFSATVVRFNSAPANGTVVELRRVTPRTTAFVDYNDGSTLGETDLDNSTLQAMYLAQEALDTVENAVQEDSSGNVDALNRRIVNVANPVNAQDAATKAYGDTNWGGTAAATATTKAAEAAASATAADASADAAAASAAAAAASAADAQADADRIPAPTTGDAGKMIRVNAGETAYEKRTPAEVRSDIGAAAASHAHAGEDITSGTVAAARLGSGTPDATKFLRGDNSWQVVAGKGLKAVKYFTRTVKTFTANVNNTLTSTNHGLSDGDKVRLISSGTLPAPLAEDTTYFVINAAASTFKLSLTLGGAEIDITSTGTGTHFAGDVWEREAGTTRVVMEVQGAGGGGGGGQNTSNAYTAGGGGGGGGYLRKVLDVSSIATASIFVGAAGINGGTGNAGGTGGTSTWDDGTNSFSADGGAGGGADGTTGIGIAVSGAGGTASGGDINVPGKSGAPGLVVSASGPCIGGAGGDGVLGHGAKDNARDTAGVAGGNNASGYGGGGGGGVSFNGTGGHSGGNGTQGIIIVYEYE